MRILKFSFCLALLLGTGMVAKAGNDTKRGQAGASELLINPYARGLGMANSYSAGVMGLESMWLNLGGLAYVQNNALSFTNKIYMSGSGINISNFGLARNLSKSKGDNSVLGINLMVTDVGDLIETTENSPGGTGLNITPQFFNAMVCYSRKFTDNVRSGIGVKVVNQSIPGASATGVAIDAGIQYKNNTGRLKAGISIKNLGPKMRFTGPGFGAEAEPSGTSSHQLSMDFKNNLFEMPAMLMLSAGYDIMSDSLHRFTAAFNFTSNSYTHDHYNFGGEYAFKEMFMLRLGYSYQQDIFNENRTDVHTGMAAGFTVNVPYTIKGDPEKDKADKRYELALDYAYQTSNPFGGTHTFGASLLF